MHKLIGIFYKLLYRLDSHQLIEMRLHTWVNWILFMASILMLLVHWPGSLALSLIFWIIILLLTLGSYWARRKNYIHFVATHFAPPDAPPAPILPDETLLHHASGPFAVEEKHENWSHLVARYRTFSDREHVIMARLMPSSLWGVGAPDARMLGMWYFFIKDEQIMQLTTGKIYWGAAVEPGLKLRFQKTNDQGKQRQGVFYLHFDSVADLHRILADFRQ